MYVWCLLTMLTVVPLEYVIDVLQVDVSKFCLQLYAVLLRFRRYMWVVAG